MPSLHHEPFSTSPTTPYPPLRWRASAATSRIVLEPRASRWVAPDTTAFSHKTTTHPPPCHATHTFLGRKGGWWRAPPPCPSPPIPHLMCSATPCEGSLLPWAPSAPFFPSHHPPLPHTTQNPDLPLCQQIMGVQAPNPLPSSTPNPSQLAHHARCQSPSALGRIPRCLCVENGSGSLISHAHFCLTMPFSPPLSLRCLRGRSSPSEGIGRKYDYGCRWCVVSCGWCSWWGGMLAK